MNSLANLRARLSARFPLIMVLLLVLVNSLFCAASVMPQWIAYEALNQQVIERQTQAVTGLTQAAVPSDLSVHESQIAAAETALAEAASVFLSSDQVDDLLDQLYLYAENQNVIIVNLQTQQSVQTNETLPYETRMFRLQVHGSPTQLMRFVVQIREATIPGVVIDTLNLSESEDSGVLTMDVRALLSPLAKGNAFAELAPEVSLTPMTIPLPEAVTTNSDTLIPESTSVITAAPGSVPPAPVIAENMDPAATPSSPTATPAAPIVECPDAAPVQFQVGDWVVVDFNQTGALRLMDRVDGGAPYTQVQLYDNEVVRILAGPVCGHMNQVNIWYWYVDYEGHMGWVGEGTAEDRWLCPLQEPECAQ